MFIFTTNINLPFDTQVPIYNQINDLPSNVNLIIYYTNNKNSIKEINTKYPKATKALITNDQSIIYIQELCHLVDFIIPNNIKNYQNIYYSNIKTHFTFPFNTNFNSTIYLGNSVKNLLNEFYNLDYHLKINTSIDNSIDNHIILYDDINDLKFINHKNKKFFNINSDNIDEQIIKINEYINIVNNSNKNTFENTINYISNFEHFKIEKIEIINLNQDNEFQLNKNTIYLFVRKGTILYDLNNITNHFLVKQYFQNYNCVSYLIDNHNDKEIAIIISPHKDIQIKLIDIIHSINYTSDKIIGYNEFQFDEFQLYYIYGIAHLWDYYFPLSKLNKYYLKLLIEYNLIQSNYPYPIHNETISYNKHKLIRIFAFNVGLLNLNYHKSLKKINEFINENQTLFIQDKILLISKTIIGYGGNQKTARQLYDNLTLKYDTYVLSLAPSDTKSYCFKRDAICRSINNMDIIKIKQYENIISHINSTPYIKIINNKLNELINYSNKINHDIDVISHNPNDPFNLMILLNKCHINDIFTINKDHKQLLINEGMNTYIYNNYIDDLNKFNHTRETFKKTIVFVGRLSHEKNVDILLDAWELILQKRDDLNLIIIGDGKQKFFKEMQGITYYGKLDYSTISVILLNSDYLILPSCTEGIPFTILEAMSLGIPCISTNISGINEYVIPNKSGFLIELEGYKSELGSWDVMKSVQNNYDINKVRICDIISEAYEIGLNEWYKMSDNCYEIIKNRNFKNIVNNFKN